MECEKKGSLDEAVRQEKYSRVICDSVICSGVYGHDNKTSSCAESVFYKPFVQRCSVNSECWVGREKQMECEKERQSGRGSKRNVERQEKKNLELFRRGHNLPKDLQENDDQSLF